LENALAVAKLAATDDMPLSTLAQRYLFATAEADRVVVGARNLPQMKATLEDWYAGTLPEYLFDAITNILIKNHQSNDGKDKD
jgi:aryl-alcohol dehydrogenase-like predicted oxidoreductase